MTPQRSVSDRGGVVPSWPILPTWGRSPPAANCEMADLCGWLLRLLPLRSPAGACRGDTSGLACPSCSSPKWRVQGVRWLPALSGGARECPVHPLCALATGASYLLATGFISPYLSTNLILLWYLWEIMLNFRSKLEKCMCCNIAIMVSLGCHLLVTCLPWPFYLDISTTSFLSLDRELFEAETCSFFLSGPSRVWTLLEISK